MQHEDFNNQVNSTPELVKKPECVLFKDESTTSFYGGWMRGTLIYDLSLSLSRNMQHEDFKIKLI